MEGKLNMVLIGAGAALLVTGVVRMGIIKADSKFLIENLPLLVVAIVLFAVIYRTGGTVSVQTGLSRSGKMAVSFLPMLCLMFLTMGPAMVLIDSYRDQMLPYIAGRSGLFGTWLSAFVMPGSLTSVPIVKELWYSNAESRAGLLLFLAVSPLIGWQVFLIRQPMLGWRLTLIMFGINLLYSLVLYSGTWLFMKIFKL